MNSPLNVIFTWNTPTSRELRVRDALARTERTPLDILVMSEYVAQHLQDSQNFLAKRCDRALQEAHEGTIEAASAWLELLCGRSGVTVEDQSVTV